MPNYAFLTLLIRYYFELFSDQNVKFCPQIYKTENIAISFSSYQLNLIQMLARSMFGLNIEKMETCCSSILECDAQKRAELTGISIEDDMRHCECENKFRDCLSKSKDAMVMGFGGHYFRKTAKCYSVDHPIIECDQYRCYYQPNAAYEQYPPGAHVSGAVRCVKNKLDKSKPKIYQTFELPFYYEGFSDTKYMFLELESKDLEDGSKGNKIIITDDWTIATLKEQN